MSDDTEPSTATGSFVVAQACPPGEADGSGEAAVQHQAGIETHAGEDDKLAGLLEAEAERLSRPGQRGRGPTPADARLASADRSHEPRAPKLKSLSVETAIIERHRRQLTSVEEAMLEMSLARVAGRRLGHIAESLWGARVDPTTVRELHQKIAGQIDAWRHQRITGEHPYLFLDGIWLKRTWGAEIRYMSVLVAVGVSQDGYREVLGVEEGTREDQSSWRTFLLQLKNRGLAGVRLVVGDRYFGLKESVAELFPEASFQRCVGHFYRYMESLVSVAQLRSVGIMLKAIHAAEDRAAAEMKAAQVVRKLAMLKLPTAAAAVGESIGETLSYYDFPGEHHRSLRTNGPLERIMREIRQRARVCGVFPDSHCVLLLVCARLRHVACRAWGVRRFMDMSHLRDLESRLAASLEQAS